MQSIKVPPPPSAAPPNAVARARLAQLQMVERHRQAADQRSRRTQRRNFRIGIASTILVSVALVVAISYGLIPTAPKAIHGPADPARAEFERTRSGQILAPVHGNTCRQLTFDNATGNFTGETLVPCSNDGPLPPADATAPSSPRGDRFNAFRDAFQR